MAIVIKYFFPFLDQIFFYVSRPSLDKIFRGQKAKAQRDIWIGAAHMSHGYTLKEIADYLGIHYTTVSKVIAKAAVSKNFKTCP